MKEEVLERIEGNNAYYRDPNLDDVNGWIYTGGLGWAIANWIDDLENPVKGVGILDNPSHPRERDMRDTVEVGLTRNMEHKIKSQRILAKWIGTRYSTPNYIHKRFIRKAKRYIVKWMKIHPPESIEKLVIEPLKDGERVQSTLYSFS